VCLVQGLVKQSTSIYLCIDVDMNLELYRKTGVLVFRSAPFYLFSILPVR